MNINIIKEDYIGASITVVTRSGNKIQGEVLKNLEDDILKLKTDDGIILVNTSAIESLY